MTKLYMGTDLIANYDAERNILSRRWKNSKQTSQILYLPHHLHPCVISVAIYGWQREHYQAQNHQHFFCFFLVALAIMHTELPTA